MSTMSVGIKEEKVAKIDGMNGYAWNTVKQLKGEDAVAFMLYQIFERMGEFLKRDIIKD